MNSSSSRGSSSFRLAHLLMLGLMLFAFACSAVMSRTVFERMPHLEDELAYVFQARTLAGGQLVVESPQPQAAFWQPFVVDRDGTRFGKYTLGWPAHLTLGEWLGGQLWFINAAFSALAVGVTFRVTLQVFSKYDISVAAAALVAFSPMALLLNASLMGHTVALFWTGLFISACHSLEYDRRGGRKRLLWGVVAGVAMGLLVITRPATALAVAIPFAAYSAIRLLRILLRARRTLIPAAAPLVALTAVTLLFALLIPVYNYAATGDARQNLYTLVWEYDRIGFGPGYGRNGHTLEKGVRHMRFDLSLTAADLFGWQAEPLTDATGAVRAPLTDHFLNQADYYPVVGLSWVLLPLGFLVAFGRRSWAYFLWGLIGLAWLALPFHLGDGSLSRNPDIAWIIIFGLMAWVCAPLLVLGDRRATWSWLIAAVALSLIIVQLTYWIGSQRYSTRYYYEGVLSAAIFTALPIAWLARRVPRGLVYGAFAAVLALSFFGYAVPRVGVLRGFNLMDGALVAQIQALRDPARETLVLVTGDDVRWRSYGELMAITSPYLDSPIVAARITPGISREDVLARFPDREVIDLTAQENTIFFPEPP
ncbi:MAG: hypothetical protein KME04_19005 [Pleurocapsa minor GSE-CHR-MK-17-07R]|nr:hypothetical protein [Pleurocapsa minor GSE-CHR-MK 17-07R]